MRSALRKFAHFRLDGECSTGLTFRVFDFGGRQWCSVHELCTKTVVAQSDLKMALYQHGNSVALSGSIWVVCSSELVGWEDKSASPVSALPLSSCSGGVIIFCGLGRRLHCMPMATEGRKETMPFLPKRQEFCLSEPHPDHHPMWAEPGDRTT